MVRLTEADKQALSVLQDDVLTPEQTLAILHTFARQLPHIPHTSLVYKRESLEECSYNLCIQTAGSDVVLAHGWGYSKDTIESVVETFVHSDIWKTFDVYLTTDFEDYDYALYFYSTDIPGVRESAIRGSFKFRYNKEA